MSNNNNNSNSTNNGIGFCGLLAIVFIVLKLCNVINWSWWWVLSPIWIPTLLVVVLLGFTYLILKFGKL